MKNGENKSFNLYPLLIAVLATSQILCFIFARRQVDLFFMPTNVSGIIFPLDLYLVEIIGECYGYEYSRQSVWINAIIHLTFLTIVFLVSVVPYSKFMHQDLVFSYQHLIDISPVVVIGSLCGTFLGDLFSARFVPQTKIILKGKHTFLRLFFSQIISEAIVTSSYFLSFLTNNYTFMQTLHLVLDTIFIKSLLALLLWPIVRIFINMIKSFEKMEGFDYQQDYKTLAFAIDNDLVDIRGVYYKS